ncbi:peptidylprolyl isomerase [Desulforhopalus sp. IMCC35007]|uniref:FKBP-type peptidyl-prolyl cis-trans isomerase n=1 Tax=Desulforhopalus sp. IMCC35007 TaxID=2569543 RepID=UPI00145C9DA1|nr:FKBP-type peptidyl-prolyl cis-trans isomerase [Desulforhopalus sp. IMCC35007]
MNTPQNNDTVVLAFTGSLDNGEIFYEVKKDDPMHVVIGGNNLPPSLEATVRKMTIGDLQKVRVPPEEAYGPRQKELLQTIDNQEVIDRVQPKPGMVISLKTNKDGEEVSIPATVIEVEGSQVTVDYNHPLAGHHLNYRVELLDIKKSN